MGCSFSCNFSCRSSPSFHGIRVVHLNGYVEEFEDPITVSQVTGEPPKHFVCTAAQLLSSGSKPLRPSTQLEPGHLYFLLPYSFLQSDTSHADLASLVARLTAMAKRSRSNSKIPRSNSISSQRGFDQSSSSSVGSPSRFLDGARSMEHEPGVGVFAEQRSSRARSWKPILDTIRERSFNRPSESDLVGKHPESPK